MTIDQHRRTTPVTMIRTPGCGTFNPCVFDVIAFAFAVLTVSGIICLTVGISNQLRYETMDPSKDFTDLGLACNISSITHEQIQESGLDQGSCEEPSFILWDEACAVARYINLSHILSQSGFKSRL